MEKYAAMIYPTWLKLGLGLSALGLLVLALPEAMEGPEMLSISEGHALSLLDGIAIIPLIIGTLLLQRGILNSRQILFENLLKAPLKLLLVFFGGGLGLGLLLASAFSSFYWWWAIGGLIYAIFLVYAGLMASRKAE